MKRTTNRDRAQGFTLIELMIGVAVTVIVVGALIEVFNSQQRMYYQQSQMAKSQSAARTALHQLSRDLRMAGYTGIPLGSDTLLRGAANYFPLLSIKDGGTVLTSLAGTSGPMAYANTIRNDLAGLQCNSDAIEIRGNFTRAVTTTPAVTAGVSEIAVANPDLFLPREGFNAPGWIVVGNLSAVYIFPITEVDLDKVRIGIPPSATIDKLSDAVIIWAAPLFSRVYFATPDSATLPANRRQRLMVANYLPTAANTNVVMAGGLQGGPLEFAVDIADFQVTYDLQNPMNSASMLLGRNMVCNLCLLRSVTALVRTESDQFRENNPLMREFTTSVRVRNIGLDNKDCTISPVCAWEY